MLGAACATAAAPAEDGAATDAPDPIDDFQITLFGNENHEEGATLNLTDYVGKPVVLNFWYPSCPPCRLEMPDLEATFNKHRSDGLEFIGVMALILNSVEEGQAFIDEFGITYAVGPDADSKIIIDFKVRGFPTTIFLDRNQEIVRSWTGALTGEKLEEFVLELLE